MPMRDHPALTAMQVWCAPELIALAALHDVLNTAISVLDLVRDDEPVEGDDRAANEAQLAATLDLSMHRLVLLLERYRDATAWRTRCPADDHQLELEF